MAKFTDYTQKTKPADADLLLIHDNAGAANKKTPFSGVWSWILDKLASAVISQLETTNKSIIPAINELNSKSLLGYKLREKYIENAEIVIAGTTKVIRSGVTFSGTIPIFFYSTDRSGWQFLIFRHQNEYNDWLMALNDSADGTFSGYFYYLEEV